MFRKLTYILGFAIVLSSVPVTSIAQVKVTTEEHRTGVKRTVRKTKPGVRHAYGRTGNPGVRHAYGRTTKPGVRHAYGKSKRGYIKTKTRVINGDAHHDAHDHDAHEKK